MNTLHNKIKDKKLFKTEIVLLGILGLHDQIFQKLIELELYQDVEEYCKNSKEKLMNKLFEFYANEYKKYYL